MFLLACLAGTVLVLVVRRGRRRGWADDLPAVAFLAAGLAAQRNLPMAAVVVAPVRARALTFGRDASRMRNSSRPNVVIAGALAALAALFLVVAARGPALELDGYPVAAARLVPPGTNVVTSDVAAGYLILQRGRQANVFIDDRFDMYPAEVTEDLIRLRLGRPDSLAILDRYRVDAVLWEADRPLQAMLATSDRWRPVGKAGGWVVYRRT
jgi:hypothetical protein